MSDELPPGWALTDIGTLGRYINGRGFGKSEWKKIGLPIIRIQNLNDESAPFNYSDQEYEEKYRVRDDDLLVAWAASLGVYLWKRGPAWLNQHIFRVEVEERAVTKQFLYYALKDALAALYKKAHGSGMVHITKAKFDRHSIKLSPLNEQKRIVSKIEELFSRIDEGERALERVSKLVERYRQSVLKAAVTGELTRDWREARKARGEPVETGEALLARILTARREAWEQAELAKMQAKGITPKDDEWKKKYKEPTPPDTSELSELPEEWVWTSLGQLFQVSIGSTPSRKASSYWGGGIPWVSSGEVAFCRISKTKETISQLGYDSSSVKLHPKGTVMLAMIGEGKTRGQAAILDIEACHNQNAASIGVSATPIPPEYIYNYLRYRYEIVRGIGQGGNQPALNGDLVKGIAIPLPPLEEIAEICEVVERQFAIVAAFSTDVSAQHRLVDAQRQAILRGAFNGTLVAQDLSDEPASVVLERIASSRGEAKTASSKRTRKKKSA